MNPLEIIAKYYPMESEAYRILVNHSKSVAEKTLAIARMHPEMSLDLAFIEEAAMLHDIGIFRCDAPEIDCHGNEPYIRHGYLRVCERHTGCGITAAMVEAQQLPLPKRDFTPETMEEQLICFADKFYSKTKLDKEKPIEKVRKSLAKYGEETVERFDNWCKLFLGE